jgi:subfamily B ATP-binding cassette protein MsbA
MRYLIEYFNQIRKFIPLLTILFIMLLIMVVGFIESIGIALFLPILQSGFGGDKLSQGLKLFFNFFNLSFSFKLLLIFIVSFFMARAVILIFYFRYLGRVVSNLIIKVRRELSNKVFIVDYLYLLKKEIGYVNNAIVREAASTADAFRVSTEIIKYMLYSLIYIALSMLLNFKVTLIIIGFTPVLFVSMKYVNTKISHASRQLSSSYGKFNSIIIQCLSKIKYLKATLSHTKISKIVEEENKNLGDWRFDLFFWQSLTKNLLEFVVVVAVISLLFYHVGILQRSVNEIVFLVFLFMQVTRQFINAQNSYRKFLASRGSIEIFTNLLRELEENKEDLNLESPPPDFGGEIKFQNVTVVFPNGKKALDTVNIKISPKSTVAFVGHSGSGKSTIANMVTGILKPTNGKILFGDTDYDRLNLKVLRENIGYVTQEDIIFNASVKDNISLWNERIDENKLARVIEMAHMKSFVNDLPDKENSMLGDNGLDISGGQRQRVTIARELYKNAELLILDEATSSLDSKFEKERMPIIFMFWTTEESWKKGRLRSYIGIWKQNFTKYASFRTYRINAKQ